MSTRRTVLLRRQLVIFIAIPFFLVCAYEIGSELAVQLRGEKIFTTIVQTNTEYQASDSLVQKITARSQNGTVYGPFSNSFFSPGSKLKAGASLEIRCFKDDCAISERYALAINFAEAIGLTAAGFYLASILSKRKRRFLQVASGAIGAIALFTLLGGIFFQYFP
jgi:hypothetical protein